MPTTRPRYTLTETDELAAALADAAQRWPQHADSKPRLLLALVRAGQVAIGAESEHERDRRRAAVRRTSGALTGVYDPGYLEELRREWPE